MESIYITYNPDISREIYKEYFLYERAREYRKIPSKIILGLSFLMIALGLIFNLPFLWFLGAGVTAFTAMFLFIYFIRFQIVMNNFFKAMDERDKSSNLNFELSFDSEKIIYKAELGSTEMNWELIKSYEINGSEVYLFHANRNLIDIFSNRILGHEKFALFLEILNRKVN